MIERLQKFLAQSGVASRRQAEQMMLEGRVKVNGQAISELGFKIDTDKDWVKVDGKAIRPERPAYILMNKPRTPSFSTQYPKSAGITSTISGRDTMADFRMTSAPEPTST